MVDDEFGDNRYTHRLRLSESTGNPILQQSVVWTPEINNFMAVNMVDGIQTNHMNIGHMVNFIVVVQQLLRGHAMFVIRIFVSVFVSPQLV